MEWAKAFEASRGVWMPRSHWRALRVVAQFYHEGIGCAFATLRTLAEQATISPRHLRRTITELDELGLVKRNAVQRRRDKSDASNEYELPAYRLVDADAAIRSRIFSVARERIAEQARLELPELDDEKLSPWMQFLACMRAMNFGRRDEDGSPPPSGHDDKGGCPIVPVDCERECPGEGTPCPRSPGRYIRPLI
jgi:DNA-binding transcriptional ArsR family regulator